MRRWTETELIDLVRRWAGRRRRGLRVAIGDDTAVLSPDADSELLVTTDLFVEGVHFRRDLLPAHAAGERALARALSDIAAMGGRPCFVFLSLALPLDYDAAWLRGFLDGFRKGANRFRVAIAGGDTGSSGSPVFLCDVIAIGQAPKGTAIQRSGARPGDLLYVSGRLGLTAKALRGGRRLPAVEPRLDLGWHLRRRGLASAMIDISDGLSTDLHHICDESRTGAEVNAALVPRAGSLEDALNGGEDYELLFTVPPSRARWLPGSVRGVKLTRIGHVTRARSVVLVHPDGRKTPLPPRGWEHFGKRRGRR